jgi:hypothetical protein
MITVLVKKRKLRRARTVIRKMMQRPQPQCFQAEEGHSQLWPFKTF